MAVSTNGPMTNVLHCVANMTDQKLLPCPHCGSDDVVEKTYGMSSTKHSFVMCNKCGAQCDSKNTLPENDAVTAWNMRSVDCSFVPSDVIKALTDMIHLAKQVMELDTMESKTIRDAEDVLNRISEQRTMTPITPEQAHDMYMSFMVGMNWSLMDLYFRVFEMQKPIIKSHAMIFDVI